MTQLRTKKGQVVRMQVTEWENITDLKTEDFSKEGVAFVIKNENDASIVLEVMPFDGDTFVATKFNPGWNIEIVKAVKTNILLTDDELANIKWGN